MAPTARLVCVLGHEVGKTFQLDGAEPVIIGRGSSVSISIEGTEVSRRHAMITRRQDHNFVLRDLSSRNGTTVNGALITEHVLTPGDRIHLGGGTVLMFTIHDDLESRALRFQRLESLATVTGGIVHDFKNTLGVIIANAELLQNALAGLPRNEEHVAMVGDIALAATAGLETAKRLLYFSDRQGGEGWTNIDVASLVDEVLAIVRRPLVLKRIRLEVQTQAAMRVWGSRDELHHALLNLVVNARDAMPDGGTLRVAARALALPRAESMRLHLPLPGTYVEIEVSDTGTGMDAATRARIFEPFFTTKPSGVGTGLGLPTVYGTIRRHGGNVLVDSTLGKGTVMRVLIPASRIAAAED